MLLNAQRKRERNSRFFSTVFAFYNPRVSLCIFLFSAFLMLSLEFPLFYHPQHEALHFYRIGWWNLFIFSILFTRHFTILSIHSSHIKMIETRLQKLCFFCIHSKCHFKVQVKEIQQQYHVIKNISGHETMKK